MSSLASSNGRKSSVTSEYDVDEGESKTTLFLARLVVSIFAVGLLWLTSLSTVVQIVNLDAVIDVPEPKEVFNTGIEMYNVTIRLRNEYIECIADAVSECNQSLYVKMENEGARVAAASKVNVLAVNVALEVQSSCSSSRAYALAAVTAWQERQGLNSTNHYTDACTAEERSSARRDHRRPDGAEVGDLLADQRVHRPLELDGRVSSTGSRRARRTTATTCTTRRCRS